MRQVLVIGACALALTACQKKPAQPADSDSTATAAAQAPSKPTRKAGLWQISMDAMGRRQVMKQCVDAASEAEGSAFAQDAMKGQCSQNEVTPIPGGWKFQSVCKMGQEGTVTTTGTATGDMSSHYVVKASSVTAGSSMPQANGTHEFEMQADYQGACPADMKGGDVEVAGMKFNPAAMRESSGRQGR